MAIATPGNTAELSDPALTQDRPPRLSTCINQAKVGPDRSLDGSRSLLEGQSFGDAVLSVIEDVVARLDDDEAFDAVWDAPAGQHPNPDEMKAKPDGEAEEAWARCIERIALGAAYFGPDVAADFPSRERKGIEYIFRRFQPHNSEPLTYRSPTGETTIILAAGSNEDPAYSLAVACQQLTTYGALSRGVPLEQLSRGGIPASQAAASLKIFEANPSKWHSTEPIKHDPSAEVKSYGTITKAHAFDALRATELPGYGPGVIYTYNPVGHTRFVLAQVEEAELLRDKNGEILYGSDGPRVDPRATIKRQLEAQARTELLNATVGKVIGPISASTGQEWFSGLGTVPVKLPMMVQLDGCHVSMVLRVYTDSKGKKAVQMLDASAHVSTGAAAGSPSKETLAEDYAMFARVGGYSGMFAAEGYHTVPGEQGKFVGLGVLPAMSSSFEPAAYYAAARPVGMARLIVTRREGTKPLNEDDILFVSRMILTWGRERKTQNFGLARLLFSLRNTPAHGALQAWWVVYAPRRTLASALWEPGARERSLETMLIDALASWNEYRKPGSNPREEMTVGTGCLPVAVLTHDGVGRALQVWRAHGLKGGDGAVPRVLRSLFIDVGAPPGDVLARKRAADEKRRLAEANARTAELNRLIQQRNRAAPKAARGDEAAKSEFDELGARIDALLRPTPPEEDPYDDPPPVDEVTRLVAVRDGFLRCFVDDDVCGESGFPLPDLLEG